VTKYNLVIVKKSCFVDLGTDLLVTKYNLVIVYFNLFILLCLKINNDVTQQ